MYLIMQKYNVNHFNNYNLCFKDYAFIQPKINVRYKSNHLNYLVIYPYIIHVASLIMQ